MNSRTKKKTLIISIVVLLVFMTIGFSLLSSKLTINATGIIDSTFKILITDAYANEYNTGKNKLLTFDDVSVDFKVELSKPYDLVEYIFKVENRGSIDAVLKSVDDSGMIDSNYIKWSLVKIEEGNVETSNYVGKQLNSGDSHTFKLTIYFEESALAPPENPLSLDMKLIFNYTQ